jgi:hypothetical protein
MAVQARFLAALFSGLVLAPFAASAGPALDEVLRHACRSNPVCVIESNSGGDVTAFQLAAHEVLAENKRLVIDGRCESACVILADIARTRTCLTERAELAVHQAATMKIVATTYVRGRAVPIGKVVSRQDPPQSADIHAWVAEHGGYPADGFRIIPIEDARQFWSMCEVPQPLATPPLSPIRE